MQPKDTTYSWRSRHARHRYFPVTPTGQLVAVGVMIGGIALIGVVTATLASWIVEKVGESNQKEEAATKVEMEKLTSEIRALREELTRG